MKRRRSKHFATLESASALTPDELLREAELELIGSEEMQRFRTRSSTPGSATDTADHQAETHVSKAPTVLWAWQKQDWKDLERAFKHVHRSLGNKGRTVQGKSTRVSEEKVIECLMGRKGINEWQLSGDWTRCVEAHIDLCQSLYHKLT